MHAMTAPLSVNRHGRVKRLELPLAWSTLSSLHSPYEYSIFLLQFLSDVLRTPRNSNRNFGLDFKQLNRSVDRLRAKI